ncbi:hypothetical protein AXG93_1920s1020 [Marchantia polymorpha subsp. ruderalis]|uniref:NB-ARC domain-containing protein n=1 Tax=Marchantia polymorpha subsp. ruderalis TaxID=1480154 RepID=A0A176WEP6_MARPO|nr:hypothetical protein AXG93_1920s1020 [Marchantia polymorpha subsp. ruderalis]
MGKALRREVRESIWRQLLVALDEADNVVKLDQRLWAKFRVSYDRLGSREKEIFLLAASFFNNSTWTLGQAKSCWRVVYGFEDLLWQKLVDMSIVYDVGEEEIIQMQEQLRSLGTKLASESGTCGKCRTWTKKNVPSRFNSSNYNERMAEEQFYSSDSLHRSSSTGMKTHIEGSNDFPIIMSLKALLLFPTSQAIHQEVMALRLEDSMSLTWRDICQMKKLQYLDSEKELRLDEKGGKLPTNLLSDSVYELHKPGVESMLDDDDDILFHGLQSSHTSVAHLSTWRSRGLQMEVWPKACRRKYGLFQGLPETFVQLPSLHHLKFSYCRRLRDLIDRGSARHLAARDLKAPLTCLPTTVSLFRDLEDLILHGGLFQGSAMHWAVLDLKAWLTCLFRDLEDLKLHGGCEPNLPTLQRL